MEIVLSVSPDADDLFMVRALLEEQIDTGPYRFRIDTSPTDELNRRAAREDLDVLAISIAHYPAIADRWQLLPHGGSMGEGYGPVVVAPHARPVASLAGRRVAVPGLTTTAWAVLRMMVDVEPVVIPIEPYDRVFEALRSGDVEAALLIHEGRLTFEDEGFVALADLGEWWAERTAGLPLPLGGNVIRRGLGEPTIREVSRLLRDSIRHALTHREEAIDWLLARGGALRTREAVDRYLAMYANARTLDYGPDGRQAVHEFLRLAAIAGVVPPVEVDFAP